MCHIYETEHVASMETAWLDNVLQMVPERLKKLEASIETLSDEMREDYLLSVKKAIGLFFIFSMNHCLIKLIKIVDNFKISFFLHWF